MPEVPTAAPEVSRKRGAQPGPLPEHVPERKKACWGILTSQGRSVRKEQVVYAAAAAAAGQRLTFTSGAALTDHR